MERFANCGVVYNHALDRARQMVNLFDALTLLRPSPSNDDALRAGYFQAVSSFDFYVHELVAVEAHHRFSNARKTKALVIPMDTMAINDAADRNAAVNLHIRERNSFKAFVDPAKLSEILSCFCENPWSKILELYPQFSGEARSEKELKDQLRSIWKRRNKIAHEADVDPTFAGIGLWPIFKEDTLLTIKFLNDLGCCLPQVVSFPLP